ncbi:PREDICTED: guanine nucleotide-binding protein subunit beta-like protein 1 [Ceratosolen solmsi marchali]|uniref:Guanine nucleotide-binding protein subunit beta-like protein 1 n=1 Tax=Ceratosolen solmsi marchali TaxID=326594 RepID=A0AAJ6YGX3_9HYME|nr:PREDICTED: guanine nucleotide-binding protein subunit beta-like protein 1 [Ceratosolen solmsi marchali]
MAILPPDPVYIMKGDMGPIHSLLFRISPYVEHIYAGTESGRVHIWDLRKNRELLKLNASNEPCLALCTIGDECLITQRKGGTINLWKSQGSNWIINETIKTDYCGFCRFQVSTEDAIYIPLNESRVGLFSLKTLKTEIELSPISHSEANLFGHVMAIKPCMDESKYALITYDGGQILLWDIRSKKILSSIKIEQCPMNIDFNTSLMHGIIGSPADYLQIFSLSSDKELTERTKLPLKNPGISAVAIRPDAKVFSTGGWDRRIRIFSWKTLRPLVVLDQHKATIHDIIYSSCKVEAYNSKCLMAVAGKDGNISLWDLYN